MTTHLKAGLALAAITLACQHASAQGSCSNPDALGTTRMLKIDVTRTEGIGSFQFDTPPLKAGEVVLTFDDGPTPWATPKVLDALAKECVRAAFFPIGERAEKHPELVKREVEAGHTIGSHSFSHTELPELPEAEAEDEIVEGYRAVETAAYGESKASRPRFFRFPSFSATDQLIAFVREHHTTIVSGDMSPSDWKGDPPEQTMARLRGLLDEHDRGIIVLHDNQDNTAALLPELFAELKERNMDVVQIVPTTGAQ